MNVFFAGNPYGDSGPRIVNRNLIRCLKDEVSFVASEKKSMRLIEVAWKALRCRVIIFSGVTSYDHLIIPVCRRLRKKVVFIMHGCLKYEDKINGFTNHRGDRNEALLLKYSDSILCVSETYMHFIQQQFPQYAHKISFLTNGIDWQMLDLLPQSDIRRDDRRIVLIGGGRTTKRNLEVCKAVELLNRRSHENFFVEVYGDYMNNDQSLAISQMPFTVFHPPVSHDRMMDIFKGAFLFIQNSELESFSLGVVEALVCGCSILISENVGAKDIIPGLTGNDTISDTSDIGQIADKILLVSKTGNNRRLFSSIDKEASSIQSSANKLLRIARNLANDN